MKETFKGKYLFKVCYISGQRIFNTRISQDLWKYRPFSQTKSKTTDFLSSKGRQISTYIQRELRQARYN